MWFGFCVLGSVSWGQEHVKSGTVCVNMGDKDTRGVVMVLDKSTSCETQKS